MTHKTQPMCWPTPAAGVVWHRLSHDQRINAVQSQHWLRYEQTRAQCRPDFYRDLGPYFCLDQGNA